MKRIICFILSAVMVLGLLAGCGQTQSGEDTTPSRETTQSTQQEAQTPPRTAEELVPRLNAELKARDIPLEFVHQGEYTGQSWNTAQNICYSLYQAKYSVDGTTITTDTFDLSVDYKDTPADPMITLQIWVSDDATERERELHKTVCAIAAQLCDAQMSEETAEQLLATEPSNTPYAVFTGEIGSFTKAEDTYVPVSDDPNEDSFYLDQSTYRAVFCQNADLTHTIYRQLSTEEAWYELYFDQTSEMLFGGRIFSAPSVEELEQRINDAFMTLEVPVTCSLVPYMDYGQWRAAFRWTTLEKEDYAYPEYPYEEWGQTPEEVEEEWVTQYIQSQIEWVDLSVYAVDPFRKDAPVSRIHLGQNGIAGLPETLCIACDPENGAGDFAALQSMTPVPGDWEGYEESVLQKEDYSITRETNLEYGSHYYSVEYDETGNWYAQDPAGEALLNPAYLDYEFRIDGPMVVDGMFNFLQGYQTYFCGSYDDELSLADVLHDFLICTRSQIAVDINYYIDDSGLYRYYYGLYGAPWSGEDVELDRNAFRIYDFSYDNCSEITLRYNTDVEQYLTDSMFDIALENVLYAPIGLGLLLDEALTAEEAIRLQTHAIEYDYIADAAADQYVAPAGYQITVYGTGDVVHVLAEDPESGDHFYIVMTRAYMKVAIGPDGVLAYAHLEQYLDD